MHWPALLAAHERNRLLSRHDGKERRRARLAAGTGDAVIPMHPLYDPFVIHQTKQIHAQGVQRPPRPAKLAFGGCEGGGGQKMS